MPRIDRLVTARDEGITVVLTTHDMDEAAKLSDPGWASWTTAGCSPWTPRPG